MDLLPTFPTVPGDPLLQPSYASIGQKNMGNSLLCRSAMIMSVKLECRGRLAGTQECAGCNKKIHDKYVLKVG